jgi:hypothetical protein
MTVTPVRADSLAHWAIRRDGRAAGGSSRVTSDPRSDTLVPVILA